MRNERKYKIISLMAMLLAVVLLGNCFREFYRMEATQARQDEEYVLKGAKVYAQNCVQCHGPRGEGVIGLPLNRTDFKVDPESPAGKNVYSLIYDTVDQGRAGNKNHFQWVKMPDGKWMSYTEMPAWGKDNGGPLDSDYLKAVTLFIMKEDGSQWSMVGDPDLAPFQDPLLEDKDGSLPLPDSTATDVNAAAQALLRNRTKSQCLNCHTVGARGSKIGPDLSNVGSWGIDQTFLENWIKYANRPAPKDADQTPAMAHDLRMPYYWAANRATTQPDMNLQKGVTSEGPYFMPRFKDKLTDEEITILAKYLLGLK